MAASSPGFRLRIRGVFVTADPFTFVSNFGVLGAGASEERVLLTVGGMAKDREALEVVLQRMYNTE